MIRRTMSAIDGLFTAIAATALAAMTLLVVADVSLRYGAGAPLFFAHDVVVLYLTPLVFFFGFGPTFWRDEHLAVDLLTVKLPVRPRALTEFVSAAIGTFIFGLLTWVSWGRAWTSFRNDEVIASIVPWPAWASYAIVPIGTVAMILVCMVRMFMAAEAIRTGRRPGMPEHELDGGEPV
ncbi:TRAP transporter small permease [Marinovum sp. SP66]|uniref:TRAP transporter small permease n=1 Tax=Marinovum sp. SP66 TaxID=3028379 RepID=UPI00237B5FD7|nr:TRAP transporter small permease [Marinovum sp. SP66]MDD9739787.1 TRAP transporter small permease [Marinovum sp. SP66]